MKQKRQKNKKISEIIQKINLKKVDIEIIELGQLPFQINQKMLKCKSELFEIKSISYETIPIPHELEKKSNYIHSTDNNEKDKYILDNDSIINTIINCNNGKYIKKNTIYCFISYIHMAEGWYCRRVDKTDKCIVFSFADIYDKLASHNIPPENLLISTLTAYAYCFYSDGELPTDKREREIMHRDTRGCIMDFCVNNIDVIFSAERPYLCSECVNKLSENLIKKHGLTEDEAKNFSENLKININKDLNKIKKNWLIRVKEFIQKHIYLSLSFSLIFPFAISVFANINFSRPFSWKLHGLSLVTTFILIIWLICFIILMCRDVKKFKKFRNRESKILKENSKNKSSIPRT